MDISILIFSSQNYKIEREKICKQKRVLLTYGENTIGHTRGYITTQRHIITELSSVNINSRYDLFVNNTEK